MASASTLARDLSRVGIKDVGDVQRSARQLRDDGLAVRIERIRGQGCFLTIAVKGWDEAQEHGQRWWDLYYGDRQAEAA